MIATRIQFQYSTNGDQPDGQSGITKRCTPSSGGASSGMEIHSPLPGDLCRYALQTQLRHMPEYCHTLIPQSQDPLNAETLLEFLAALESAVAAPENSSLRLSYPSGRIREFRNPFTQEVEQISILTSEIVADRSALLDILAEREHFNLVVSGSCPKDFLPWLVSTPQDLSYSVAVTARPFIFSTSCWHHDDRSSEPPRRSAFGQPCSSKSISGLFHHPLTMAVIEVPFAGSARFVLEFSLGKCIPPGLDGHTQYLHPTICQIADAVFDFPFHQGFHWCA
jgi:hypothetical protein